MTKYLFATVFIFTVCSTMKVRANFIDTIYYADTVYFVSTEELKSNKIPDKVLQMTELRNLSIYGMDCDNGNTTNCWQIKEIPPGIKNLKKLVFLQLQLNAIKTIPNELSELRNLTLLDLSDNAGLTNVDIIAKIPALQYLYLYGCGLTKLPDDIGSLKNLKELGLVGNNLNKAEQERIAKALPNCKINF
jgi:Leucine-rich repeat (LRR) protein